MNFNRGAALLLTLLLLPSMVLSLPPFPIQAAPPEPPWLDPFILEQMETAPDGQAGFFVLFRERADLSSAYRAQDWEMRGRLVYDTLAATTARSQARVQEWLDSQGIPYTPFVIDNSLFITADKGILKGLAVFPEVTGFRGNHLHELAPIIDEPDHSFPTGVAWSIAHIGADQVWQDFGVKGQGVVVANIDTGVEYQHDALLVNYKCSSGPHDDCWYDPSNVCSGDAPCDNDGHGTHTMGTMVGDDNPALTYNAGVAPDAQWIACKGCEYYYCSDYALTACADWILAPNGDPAKRPHVVNNSWGGWGCDSWYQPKVQAWRAAGIFPAFSAGNEGPGCNSLGSPGDLPESFSSGATDASDYVAYFSSRGPSCWNEIKPEVTAPGVNVCSSYPGNDWSCSYSGTSMASPHSAGLAALIWSANPSMIGDIDATEYLITSTASCIDDLACGGNTCPGNNNVYGWGRIDAYAAVQLVAASGMLVGQVTSAAGGNPLTGAAVVAQHPGAQFSTLSDSDGRYTFTLPSGTYTVSASTYGYYPLTVTNVVIITDTTETLDFSLQPRPRYVISGTVSEAGTGQPLEARISAEGTPVAPVWSDPVTGFYTLTLIEGSYSLRAAALLHLSERVDIEVDQDQTANFALERSLCALLVDDDADQPNVRDYYTSTLDALGVPYQVWDVSTRGALGQEDLLGNWIVLWWTGNDDGEILTEEDEAALMSYLDARGNLFLSSQDYLDDEGLSQEGLNLTSYSPQDAPSTLQQDYLHVGYYRTNTGGNDPLGNSGDPIGEGLGPFLLVPPQGWSGPLRGDDVTNDGHGGASSPFRWQSSGEDNSTDYDGGSFKTVFLAWPFEGLISLTARRAVMTAVLTFFGSCQPTGLLLGQVIDANTRAPLPGVEVVPIPEGGTAELSPQASTDPHGHFTFTLPAGYYELTAYQPGYEPEVVSAISVPAGVVTRLEVSLRSPRLDFAPEAFSWSLLWEETTSATLVLSNSGTAGPLEWQIFARRSVPAQMPEPPTHPTLPRPGRMPSDQAPPGESADQAPPLPSATPAGWDYDTPLPSPRYRSAAFVAADGSFFVSGGYPEGYGCLDENLRYDPATGDWTAMRSMPTARANLQAAVVDGIAYLPGGYCGGYLNTMEAYDIAQDTWNTNLSPLPEARAGAMVAAVNRRVYVCGGSPGPSAECWSYDPATDVWTTISPMPQGNSYGAAFEHNGYLYIVAGSPFYPAGDAFWRYNPSTDTWEQGPSLNSARMSPGVAVYGNDVYAIGGGDNDWVPHATVERYALSSWPYGQWELLPQEMPLPVIGPASGCTDGGIHLAGGYDYWGLRSEHQVLDEGRKCYRPGAEAELPWLAMEPLSGSLAMGEQQTVTLQVDAGAVPDPICYQGFLLVQDNTVYEGSSISLTLCVTPTPDLGKLQGTVQELGYCDEHPRPSYTEVHIESSAGMTWTVTTDGSGHYHRWLRAGTYTVMVGAPGNITQTHVVQVSPAQTTTLDVSLRYMTNCLKLSPRALAVYAPQNTVVQRSLYISNSGAVPLTWEAHEALLPGPFFGPLGESHGKSGGLQRYGGPDPYGYTFRDSAEPGGPVYSWIELAGTKPELPIGWYGVATTTLPFPFTFYGITYTAGTPLYLSLYGHLFFEGYGYSDNDCLPTYDHSAMMAPYWDIAYDYVYAAGIYTDVQGVAPNRMFIVEWHQLSPSYYYDTITFQAILFEGSNDILFQYRDVLVGDPYEDMGASATTGIQGNQSWYLEYSCNTPALTDSLAICFEPPGSIPGCGVTWADTPWLEVAPSAGQLPADGQVTIDLLMDTNGLERGVYRAAVGILSDDPRQPSAYVPIALIVGLDRQIYLPLILRGPPVTPVPGPTSTPWPTPTGSPGPTPTGGATPTRTPTWPPSPTGTPMPTKPPSTPP